ncbi:MAG TPA: Holliday junction branch migration protein RuvA [Tepidisphaeraceae bacterium]|nr:Holliday junction branch migration protein RuvA [Tepidisphaeraceae bacterium]
MISAITGQLVQVDEGTVEVQVGPILCELLVPAADIAELQASLGEEITLHTIFYLEGDAARGGGLEPRLIGFLRADDRRFFNVFTTVKGIGPKTALKALTEPVGRIAQAIESKDTRFLVHLKGIGKRTAELIVAELSGKLTGFALDHGEKVGVSLSHRAPAEEDAISGMVNLGLSRAEAEHLLDRARQVDPTLTTADAFLREMLRLRAVRA